LATVLHPGQPHEGVADSVEGLAYAAVHVPTDLVADVVGSAATPTFENVLLAAAPVRRLLDASRLGSGMERREQTLTALSLLLPLTGRRHERSVRDSVATATKRILDVSYRGPVSVRAVAEQLEVAPGSLIRAFRRHTGLAPYAYVLSRRVDLARRLLEAGAAPVDVAQQAGFYDQAHLTRHFSRLVGVAPGAYRRG
jgi:AraC-like DNA-binding protein